MRTVLRAALSAALLALAGCSLTIDPDGVEPPAEGTRFTARGACVATGDHKLCGGAISAGESNVASASHRIIHGRVTMSARDAASAEHKIVKGDVSP